MLVTRPTPRRAMTSARGATVGLALALAASPLTLGPPALWSAEPAAKPGPGTALSRGDDPLPGRWLGTVGPAARERIAVGLELRPGAGGTLELLLTQPISNEFAVAAPGPVRRDGDTIRVEALALELTLRDGRLEGTYPGPNSPATFERVAELPGPPLIPTVPTGPGPRWQTRLGGQVYAGPTAEGGVAYVGNTGGVMNAVRVADGQLAWAFGAGCPILGQASVTADAVYFVCDHGFLFKLGRADGAELWRYDLGDSRVGRVMPHPAVFDWDWQAPQPRLADGVVYVGAGDGGFHAVDAASGQRRWRFAAGGRLRNAALLDGPRLIVGGEDRILYALDRLTGRELWRHQTEAPIDGGAAVAGDTVLIGNRGGGLYGLDAATGERRWRTYFWGSWVESTPVVVSGVAYVGSSDLRRVSAIDPTDGRVLWRSDVHGWTWGTPVVTADRIYAGAAGGKPYFLDHVASLCALDRSTGRLLWRWPLPEVAGAHQWGIAGSPALDGDTLVVTTIEGGILGFPVP